MEGIVERGKLTLQIRTMEKREALQSVRATQGTIEKQARRKGKPGCDKKRLSLEGGSVRHQTGPTKNKERMVAV